MHLENSLEDVTVKPRAPPSQVPRLKLRIETPRHPNPLSSVPEAHAESWRSTPVSHDTALNEGRLRCCWPVLSSDVYTGKHYSCENVRWSFSPCLCRSELRWLLNVFVILSCAYFCTLSFSFSLFLELCLCGILSECFI